MPVNIFPLAMEKGNNDFWHDFLKNMIKFYFPDNTSFLLFYYPLTEGFIYWQEYEYYLAIPKNVVDNLFTQS